ncbi:MAG: cell division protein ZapB [Treponema sp.]|jgi:hypothetical protein|nr:cell division protein ZapB [Treponema sp.]
MVSLEQVKLLETRVGRVIDHIEKVTADNTALREKLDSCQKRIDELEVLIRRFKDDQGSIEDGILAVLDKLNIYEDAQGNGDAIGRGRPAKSVSPKKEPPASPPLPAAEEAPENDDAAGDGDTGGAPAEETPPDPQESPEGELDIF